MGKFISEFMQLPEAKALFRFSSPMDILNVVGITFFFLLLYTLLGGTYAMISGQVCTLLRAVRTQKSIDLSKVLPYTRSILTDSCSELHLIRKTHSPLARLELLEILCKRLSKDQSAVGRSLLKQFQERRSREESLAMADRGGFPIRRKKTPYYISAPRGDA